MFLHANRVFIGGFATTPLIHRGYDTISFMKAKYSPELNLPNCVMNVVIKQFRSKVTSHPGVAVHYHSSVNLEGSIRNSLSRFIVHQNHPKAA